MAEMPKLKMSRWGVGPAWSLASIAYGIAVCLVDRRYFPDMHMVWPAPAVGMASGILLIAAGIFIYVKAVRRLRLAYAENRLETGGAYAWMRHPIYSAFIMFIVPGAVLMVRSVLGVTIPVFMYILFRILIRGEEAFLAARYGEEYLQWRRRTNAIMPSPPMEM